MNKQKWYFVVICVGIRNATNVYKGCYSATNEDEAILFLLDQAQSLKSDLLNGGYITAKGADLIIPECCPSNGENDSRVGNGWLSFDLTKMNDKQFEAMVQFMKASPYADDYIAQVTRVRSRAIA